MKLFPQNYRALGLPGPELLTGKDTLSISNDLVSEEPGAYILKIGMITENFSYNGRYEDTELKKTENQETVMTKGQFGEHFERKSGGYYIRVIGYTLDDKGHQQFFFN
ncbi:hypothetical protein Zmor_015326 [Zophobas morio]|uniref:Uncharacterized protein n=1 Tax=Zophobas morio TaxID=2755281 RepID=A0AA38IE19_9CUCU|nr:hypothetical protein Zmor_015326 [Zophobas morio]